ncbi:intradiol ring-cleavage dioxygenase [Ideonella sp.]|uniref:intradiol ring-cleavage dioxygenase n=1 Tax=Ideonella sp. TaxID=1929293 RepID=UPI0035B3387F
MEPLHDAHPHGLAADLNTLAQRALARRGVLRWLAAGAALAGPMALIGCGGGGDADVGDSSSDSGDTSGDTGGDTGSCSVIPSETSGPYPADGTNRNSGGTVNALAMTGIVRRDITTSFGDHGDNVAEGVPLTVTLKLVNTASSCANLAGYAVYLWHCDRGGNYSLYSSDAADENYLRGVQISDSNGEVSFTTIFPACYSGRWPHIHFEVYASEAEATSGNNAVKTSQLALPSAACQQVYGVASGYDASVSNFAQVSLSSDNVFSDDSAALQLATVDGSVSAGFTATLTVGVSG